LSTVPHWSKDIIVHGSTGSSLINTYVSIWLISGEN